jgi:formamidopyrimidine-DNA glycosylase
LPQVTIGKVNKREQFNNPLLKLNLSLYSLSLLIKRKKLLPELPEVETVRRELENALLDHTIERVEVRERRLRVFVPVDFEQSLIGLTISLLQRRGKYLLISFQQSNLTLIVHLGMSGRISIFTPSMVGMPLLKHEHIVFSFNGHKEVRFSDPRRFGLLYLTDKANNFLSSLGPEPLTDAFTADTLERILCHRKTCIKAALLDQRVVAGLGNIYVCEILHKSGIHPERLAKDLHRRDYRILARTTKEILQKAISAGGSTLRDHQRPTGGTGLFQHEFKVYGQEGKSCLSCHRDTIKRIVQAKRSTYFCRTCQI